MLSLRWNQFENQSLSVPVPAHGLRRQVRQSLRSNRLTANPIFQFCYLKKTKMKLNFEANARPPEPPASTVARDHRLRHLLGRLLLLLQCPIIAQPPSSQFAFRPTTRRVPPRAQPQGAQVMLGLRWNQFEIKSLSAPVRAHGLRRQVMQSLRSNRSNSTSHLSILPCVISKNKNEIDFDTNAPPSLTTSQHGGQRPARTRI